MDINDNEDEIEDGWEMEDDDIEIWKVIDFYKSIKYTFYSFI